VLGAIFAGRLSSVIAPWLIEFTGASPHIIGTLSYVIAFLLILVALFFAGRLLQSFVNAIKMNTLNQLAGALFCCAKWVILFSILMNLIVELDRDKHIITEDVRENARTYPVIIDIARTVIPYLRFDWIKEPKEDYSENARYVHTG
jgi:membrane protein required for colicin V production